jgi:hypothetical protein
MKSEHRRELHANELERVTEHLGKFFENHGSKVLIGLLAAVGIGIGIWWFLSSRGKRLEQGTSQIIGTAFTTFTTKTGSGSTVREQGTFQIIDAASPEKYQNVADMPELAGSKLAAVARLRSAELLLNEAIARYFTAKRAGMDDLKDAEKRFDEVLESNKLPNWVRERALYGRAVCVEAMWDGKSDEPEKAYKKLLTEFPDTGYKSLVERRMKALQNPQMRQFYAYVSTGERKASDIGLPRDFGSVRGLPPNHPPITAPERPVELPRIPDTLGLDDEAAKPFPHKTGGAKASPGKKGTGPELKFPEKTAPKSKTPDPKPEPKQE